MSPLVGLSDVISVFQIAQMGAPRLRKGPGGPKPHLRPELRKTLASSRSLASYEVETADSVTGSAVGARPWRACLRKKTNASP
jgi:hypothetical protein